MHARRSPPASETPHKLAPAALDGLRGLAAQVVLAAHAAAVFWPEAPALWRAALGWGARLAVVAFFVLSGFVIALAILRARATPPGFDPVAFAGHRAARIGPPYLASVAVAAGVAGLLAGPWLAPPAALAGVDLSVTPAALLRAVTLSYRTTDPHNLLNGPIWSLRLEVALYILSACLAVAALGRGPGRLAALLAAALAGAALAARLSFGLAALGLFAAGAAAALLRQAPSRQAPPRQAPPLQAPPLQAPPLQAPPGPRLALGGLAALLALLPAVLAPVILGPEALLAPAPALPATLVHVAIGIGVAALLLDLTGPEGPLGRALARLAGLGRFAYTLYVLHMPLLILAAAALAPWRPGPALRVAAGIAALAAIEGIALGLARVLERPRWVRRAARRLARTVPWGRLSPGGRAS
ncbi:hypothetical protein OPKNFCMD_6223 [Methylobacterium crusticola]|uniref:Acyltransferase 3 domain-containing protein n=1 Tax=Methylobacterium crusticola TaxID=1697972 RepID=A0ABQ4R704_9HYPH|nr:acyltransferase family protein [Methylobacterium crusticola]GJD53448.1 hypothetical protein OPKNFCMD_6223 [Methylobacterium crusticola]